MGKEDKARVRIFFSEIEGGNETIQDGLRSFAAALQKTFQPVIVRVIAGRLKDGDLPALENLQERVAEVISSDAVPSEIETAKAKSERSGTRSTKKQPRYTSVDIDFRPAGKESLKDFFTEKDPTKQQEKLIVVLYYLEKILKIERVSVSHVYAALKAIEERAPTDLAQTFRTISARKRWVNASDSSALTLTISGEQFVEHDLPAKTPVAVQE